MSKNTKIVCTLGPSSDSVSELETLIKAGMNLGRLNFSHGDYEDHKKIVNNLRKSSKKLNRRVGIIQDLQGPKIRIGTIKEKSIKLKKGQTVILKTDPSPGIIENNIAKIPIQYKELVKDVKKDDSILINDGLLELKVISKTTTEIKCKTIIGGELSSNKGINVPTASISAECLTKKDLKDLEFGLKLGVDFIALSFVRSEKDIEKLRKIINEKKKNTKIIAKIERHEAVKNLEKIICASDALMVARGDLGVEIPAEQVPIIQKKMIRLANKDRKPVITATQVLQSMVENPRATRAEISDAANAVYDYTDAIMLSNESAVGKFAQKAVATLRKVAEEVEKDQKESKLTIKDIYIEKNNPTDALCFHASKLSENINVKFIIAYTNSGYTAREITKTRPFTPIIVITPNESTAQELTLVWGINTVFVKKLKGDVQEKIKETVKLLKKEKLVKEGEQIIITANDRKKEKFLLTHTI
jgi:pyruvate kinase